MLTDLRILKRVRRRVQLLHPVFCTTSTTVTEQAFESGFQTAFQMLLAGLPLPEGTHDDEFPLTLQELRKMNGQRVFCLETNEGVQVVAYKKGFIRVTNDKENLPIHGLTLYRRRPSWCE